MGIIYKVTAPDGKIYVGQTIDSLENRWRNHCYKAEYEHEMLVCEAIREYGPEAFTIEVVVEAPEEDLNELERAYITKFDSLYPNGLNRNRGGSSKDKAAARQNISNGLRVHESDFDLPLNVRAVVENSEILGFRVDVPGKKKYSFRQANLSLQEKYDLAIAKLAEVLAGTDDSAENRKKKTVVGGSLPQYVYCTEGARVTVRVIVPNHRVKVFSSKDSSRKQELLDAAIAYRDKLLDGEIEDKPKVAKTLPDYIHWSETKKQASFRHPRPSAGMMKQYSFQDSSRTKEELLAEATALKDDILAGRVPERPKASKKTLPTYITWRDDLHVATFRDPTSKKTYNFGFKGSTEPKEDLIAKALAKKLEVMGI